MKNFQNRNWKKKTDEIDDEKSSINEDKLSRMKRSEQIDEIYGYKLHEAAVTRQGWLINMKPTDCFDSGSDNQRLVSAMTYYFLEENGQKFKFVLIYRPYFLIQTKPERENETIGYLEKRFAGVVDKIELVDKEDLDLDNHLMGLRRRLVKMSFYQVEDLVKARRDLMPAISRNKADWERRRDEEPRGGRCPPEDNIIDIREHDVPYQIRVSIDESIFVGKWYDVTGGAVGGARGGPLGIKERPDLIGSPDPRVLAFDIETTKLPLKFPDSKIDQVMMISYMIDGDGYLICNREIIAESITDFEFTPRPEFPGPFTVFNERDERATLARFFDHIRETKPDIFATYNGDQFDWPFVETRARVYGLDMGERIGIVLNSAGGTGGGGGGGYGDKSFYCGWSAVNIDCFRWVQRDSYLPIGAQGLKAVCKAKLRYDPVEVDPEDMCRLAREEPRLLANYSVSDAVATFYLFEKFIKPFLFALGSIVPLPPDAVLRRGSGTLCECLLMARAFRSNIVFPNKHAMSGRIDCEKGGQLLESETYVGGHVEAIESGVFRADVPLKFRLVPEMIRLLRAGLEEVVLEALEVDEKIDRGKLVDGWREAISEIDERLGELERTPNRLECPVIFHLDVAAMYPNIILTNRLQPSAMVKENKECSKCGLNTGPDALCKRRMDWQWRGEIWPASRSEIILVQTQYESETFNKRPFYELSETEQKQIEVERLTKFCRTAYKRKTDTKTEIRSATICQKENSFYVDTVRAFRDLRYEFKDLTKQWKKRAEELKDETELKRANGLVVLYDSLQLAHKCILNSFYGYVMRRGARWYSMEMAGVVCHTGAAIIKQAREIIEQIGRPLELDTDGIWCVLPASFPDSVTLYVRTDSSSTHRRRVTINYPAAMLNSAVRKNFTNHQYHQQLAVTNNHEDQAQKLITYKKQSLVINNYEIRSENSISFEIDGPYRAMILPASREQGKKLKKRYAVFNLDGSLAELKGFEVKRNGELNLIKVFQSSVFEAFLKGESLEDAYRCVAEVADFWLDWLFGRAQYSPDEELFELLSEKRCMSRKLEDYGAQKSTSISTARRLAEFLGDEMVKEAGLSFKFIISRKPEGLQVTDRAIPVAIFHTEPEVRRFYLAKWLHLSRDAPQLDEIRDIIDWDYYIGRFSNNVQKIITIPAALQHVSNPVPRVPHPDWLHKKLLEKHDAFKQKRIDEMFQPLDIEMVHQTCRVVNKRREPEPDLEPEKEVEIIKFQWKESIKDSKLPTTTSRFREWFGLHKKKWNLQREERTVNTTNQMHIKRRKSNFAQLGISSFLQSAKQAILKDTWEIIEIVELPSSPGRFRLWVLIGRQLHRILVTVPRTFYVNSRLEKPESSDTESFYYRRVTHKLLPRSRPVFHLYEYNIDESLFQQFQADIVRELVGNEIEGVYEMQVPLMFRLLVKLGCLCCVDKSVNKSNAASRLTEEPSTSVDGPTFELAHLKSQSVSNKNQYLSTIGGVYGTVHLFHQKSGRNQLIGLFVPTLRRAYLCLIESKSAPDNRQSIDQIRELYRRELEKYKEQGEQMDGEQHKETWVNVPQDIEFHISSESTELNGFRSINRLLLGIRSDMKIPSVLVVESSSSRVELQTGLNVFSEFPVVMIPLSNEYSSALQQLDWQRVAIRTAIRSFVSYSRRFQTLLDRSRYLHVPVGNISGFPTGQVGSSCDLLFARQLQKTEQVWWCSPSPDPDLGGGSHGSDRRLMLVESADIFGPIYKNRPGCYPSTCVDLELCHLPVSTAVSMQRILELDSADCRAFDSIQQSFQPINEALISGVGARAAASFSSFDESASCGPAFRALSSLILSWLQDVRKYNNPIADEHVLGFYDWLRSPESLLYEPGLIKTLRKAMNRLFSSLLERISEFGLEVVFASCNRIILATHRSDFVTGLELIEHVSQTIRQQELYAHIDLQFQSCWEFLLWLDADNYSGIKADVDSLPSAKPSIYSASGQLDDNTDNNTENSESIFVHAEDLAEHDARWDHRWHLASYLSPSDIIQQAFSELIKNYVSTGWKIIRDEFQLGRLAAKSGQGLTIGMGLDAALYATSVTRLSEFLTEKWAHKLYSLVMRLHDVTSATTPFRINNYDTSNHECVPVLPLPGDGCIVRERPIVDFINTVCHILSLDPATQYYVNDWKCNMLKIIHVGEFSIDAKWRSPYSSNLTGTISDQEVRREDLLILVPELICTACSFCRDLDLCRDAFRIRFKNSWWFICPKCSTPYKKSIIENSLLDQLNGLFEAAILQDVQCNKCRQGVLETCFARTKNCKTCGHAIVVTKSAKLLEKQVSVFSEIARYYDMSYLKCVTEWLMSSA